MIEETKNQVLTLGIKFWLEVHFHNTIHNYKVEANYTVANGYEHDAKVIYGDTDSVMVRYYPSILYAHYMSYATPEFTNKDVTMI